MKTIVGYAVRMYYCGKPDEPLAWRTLKPAGALGTPHWHAKPVIMTREQAAAVVAKCPYGGESETSHGRKIVRIVRREKKIVGYAVKMLNPCFISPEQPWRDEKSLDGQQNDFAKPVIMTKEQAKAVASEVPYKESSSMGRKVVRIVRRPREVVGYVVKSIIPGIAEMYCDTLEGRDRHRCPSSRKVFATKAEAKAICKGWDFRKVYRVTRPKR